ncbi:MAG: M15 family metallopeptidase [Eubacteriales bacterium]|nr:M15 family metallopeptidase [Eubacteriales bacterium]
MKRRILAVLLTLAILLCGCGKTPAQTEAPATEPIPVQTAAPETQPREILPETTVPEPAPEDLVRVADYIPGIYQELMYATDQNFTGQVIYDFSDAYLRYGTVKKLAAVCEDLAELELSIKIWDGFRPVSAQFRLWEVCPDPAFVANPQKGYSSHSRGNTVDVTLVGKDGTELEMPTGFDNFTARADRDYSDCTEAAAAHAELLEILMEKHGFKGYSAEWWHFSDTEEYPVEENFSPAQKEGT